MGNVTHRDYGVFVLRIGLGVLFVAAGRRLTRPDGLAAVAQTRE